jgi:aspartate carbamoyltransferase catalytic subunit
VGAEVTVCAPPTLLPAGMRPGERSEESLAMPPVNVDTDLEHAIEGADVVMALRLQKERMSGGLLPSMREYARLYQVNERRLARARPGALVMHPGPMNEGIEISPGVASGLQSVIEEQVANGVAVRMAVLYLMARGKS